MKKKMVRVEEPCDICKGEVRKDGKACYFCKGTGKWVSHQQALLVVGGPNHGHTLTASTAGDSYVQYNTAARRVWIKNKLADLRSAILIHKDLVVLETPPKKGKKA